MENIKLKGLSDLVGTRKLIIMMVIVIIIIIIKKNLNLYSGGWNQDPLDTAATNGLLCQPRMIMMMQKSVE
jgi:hypothetical protein